MERFAERSTRIVLVSFFLLAAAALAMLKATSVWVTVSSRAVLEDDASTLRLLLNGGEIGRIEEGMAVTVEWDAFPSRKYGGTSATVTGWETTPARTLPDGTPLYRVTARLEPPPESLLMKLLPGQQGGAEVRVTRKSLLAVWFGAP
ncbi:hypothetical protein [Cohnella caldifontis]|uniref:hypothetical protein n=1 Tax=Cohnella caldifontis TaxID=3027471 RepID=UPI0023ED6826|nr:hypothetical protein [Cohnella sp. YIM B05605]